MSANNKAAKDAPKHAEADAGASSSPSTEPDHIQLERKRLKGIVQTFAPEQKRFFGKELKRRKTTKTHWDEKNICETAKIVASIVANSAAKEIADETPPSVPDATISAAKMLIRPAAGDNSPLPPMDDIEREQKEQLIEEKLKSCFVECGLILKEIHDRRGYEQEYGTWAEYIRRRWHWTRVRGYQVMAAAEIAIDVKTTLHKDVPSIEHGYQLSRLTNREDLVEIVKDGNLDLPASFVRNLVDQKLGVVRGGGRRGRGNRLPLPDTTYIEHVDSLDHGDPGPEATRSVTKSQPASRQEVALRLLGLVEWWVQSDDVGGPIGPLLHIARTGDIWSE